MGYCAGVKGHSSVRLSLIPQYRCYFMTQFRGIMGLLFANYIKDSLPFQSGNERSTPSTSITTCTTTITLTSTTPLPPPRLYNSGVVSRTFIVLFDCTLQVMVCAGPVPPCSLCSEGVRALESMDRMQEREDDGPVR